MSSDAVGFDERVFGHGLPLAPRRCIEDGGCLRTAQPAQSATAEPSYG